MGRGGYGVFDSDSAWDRASDLAPEIGIDLGMAGHVRVDDLEEDEVRSLSIEDSAAYLNDGNFARVFELLRPIHRHYELILFVLLSMRVGAIIEKKYLRYIKKIYKPMEEWDHLPECRAQIRLALKEYKSGEPYTLKDFDPEGEIADPAPPSSDSERKGVKCARKLEEVPKGLKRCRTCVKECKGHGDDSKDADKPVTKRVKVVAVEEEE